ncbi:hypothetical protein GCM10009765_44310 [Fodinicola feengrottensis]|uniref:Core-binding (CB) domain-containing protein n=1 Tax=Fodinicola feengrottensis TaxID=435914 RepID=A0ABN2HM12_9ACTN
MPLLRLDRLTEGLSTTWSNYLRDWDRTLRSGNYPETTRYNYLLSAAQLTGYLGEYSPYPDADDAAGDPARVTRAHVEALQAWMIQTRSASTALNKHKCLQQFFKWLEVDENEIDQSPMARVRQPKIDQKLVPVLRDQDTAKILEMCKGKQFHQVRDEAIIRLYCNTGARLSEVATLTLMDLDMSTETVRYHGKERRVRFGPKDGPGVEPISTRTGQTCRRWPGGPVAGRQGRAPTGRQRDQDHAQAPRRRRAGHRRGCRPTTPTPEVLASGPPTATARHGMTDSPGCQCDPRPEPTHHIARRAGAKPG